MMDDNTLLEKLRKHEDIPLSALGIETSGDDESELINRLSNGGDILPSDLKSTKNIWYPGFSK